MRYKEDKPTKIDSIARLKHKVSFGSNGLISAVKVMSEDIISKPLVEAVFNQTFVLFDAHSTSLSEHPFVGTNSTSDLVEPNANKTREISIEVEQQVYYEGLIETCLLQVMSIRYLSPLFIQHRVCIGGRVEQSFKADLMNRKQELLLTFLKQNASFDVFTDDSIELTHRMPDTGQPFSYSRNMHACVDGLVALDRVTNETIGVATSVPIGCF